MSYQLIKLTAGRVGGMRQPSYSNKLGLNVTIFPGCCESFFSNIWPLIFIITFIINISYFQKAYIKNERVGILINKNRSVNNYHTRSECCHKSQMADTRSYESNSMYISLEYT